MTEPTEVNDGMNQIKLIYDKIIANHQSEHCCCRVDLFPIIAIDGIKVEVEVQILRVATTNQILLRMNVFSDWKHNLLYEYRVDKYQDLQTFIQTLPRLKYNLITNELHDGDELQQHQKNIILGYDLYKCMEKSDNITTRFDECSVCMEECSTRTNCKHTICLKCESKLHTQKCPICRSRYDHYVVDLESDEE